MTELIIFNTTKNEMFKLNENYKILHRKLSATWKVGINRDVLNEQNKIVSDASLLIIPVPRMNFDENEIQTIHGFIKTGKSVLLMSSEGGEHALNTNVNEFLEQYGMAINNDCIVRTQYYKYFHPKECYLNDSASTFLTENKNDKPSYVYPYGSTLTVTKPSIVLLTSGNVCYPANRPLCAVFIDPTSMGRILVLGSGFMLADKYIEHENNDKFCEAIFKLLIDSRSDVDTLNADEFDIWDYHLVPDIPMLAERPQLCLVDSTNQIAVTPDFTKLFYTQLHSLNTDFLPEIIKAYNNMSIKHSPLTLIIPHFEEANLPLQLSVFPPSFCELPPPSLELFDLEEEFSGEETQLAQLTNKYISTFDDDKKETWEDLTNYIQESSDVLGLVQDEVDAKRIVYKCALFVSNFKMAALNEDDYETFLETKKKSTKIDINSGLLAVDDPFDDDSIGGIEMHK